MLISSIKEAQEEAAKALSACRIAEVKGTWHEQPCTEAEPCKGCSLDAYAVTAAVLYTLEGAMADMLHDQIEQVKKYRAEIMAEIEERETQYQNLLLGLFPMQLAKTG